MIYPFFGAILKPKGLLTTLKLNHVGFLLTKPTWLRHARLSVCTQLNPSLCELAFFSMFHKQTNLIKVRIICGTAPDSTLETN